VKKFFGLVEDTQENSTMSVEEIARIRKSYGVQTPVAPEVPVDLVTTELVTVEEVYSKFNLTDTSKSIFKVDEFAKVLPQSLAVDIKRQSVVGILSASSMQVIELVSDADNRLGALQTTLDAFTDQSNGMITDAESQITELESQIDGLKQLINDRKKLQESEETLIKVETDKINDIVAFINPK